MDGAPGRGGPAISTEVQSGPSFVRCCWGLGNTPVTQVSVGSSSGLSTQPYIFWLENLLPGSKQENLARFPDFDSPALAWGSLRGEPAGSFQMPQWLAGIWCLVRRKGCEAVMQAGEWWSPGGVNRFSPAGSSWTTFGEGLALVTIFMFRQEMITLVEQPVLMF